MENPEISHQQSLVKDSFSTIERLENDMAEITREFDSLDSNAESEIETQPLSTSSDSLVELRSDASQPRSTSTEESIPSAEE